MDNNWRKTFVPTSDVSHFGDHGEDDINIVWNSVVRPARVLEL
jgi:hypothetical protein